MSSDSLEKDLQQAGDFRHTLTPETDRGCALMAAAYLDDRLRELLTRYFADDATVVQNKILGQSSPLGSFASRIDMAYVLGLVSRENYRALHLIRKIRNDFGHVAKPITFDTLSVRNRCRDLRDVSGDSRTEARSCFTGAVMYVLASIDHEIRVTKHAKILKDIDPQRKKELAAVQPPSFEAYSDALLKYVSSPTTETRANFEKVLVEFLGPLRKHAPEPVIRAFLDSTLRRMDQMRRSRRKKYRD